MAGRGVDDGSNGYEEEAGEFISGRLRSGVGAASVRAWGETLPPGATALDLGCGPGAPISQALTEGGPSVDGIGASATLAAAFRGRSPQAHGACEPIECSRLFSRTFDGVVASGVMFLLSAEAQSAVIGNAAALSPGGRSLFTSPGQARTWADLLTGRPSVSLGPAACEVSTREVGLTSAVSTGTTGTTV
jgi:hypothetical protein